MIAEEWYRLKTPEARRHAHIREAAYFLSTHRKVENRQPDVVRDWLNAEWIQDNLGFYCKLVPEINKAIRNAGEQKQKWLLNTCELRADGRTREQLANAMALVAVQFGLQVDVLGAIDRSKTIEGLIDELVDQIRSGSLVSV